MTELKPCPFCGGEAIGGKNYLGQYSAGCINENCFARVFANTKKDAEKRWNRRADNDL